MRASSSSLLLCAVVASAAAAAQALEVHNPASQVHLSLGRNASEAVVTWSTPRDGARSAVQLSRCDNATGADDAVQLLRHWIAAGPPAEVQGYARKFVDNGTLHHTQFVHRVTLAELAPAARYCYRVADNSTASSARGGAATAARLLTGGGNGGRGGGGDSGGWGQLHSFRTFDGFTSEWSSPSVTVFGDFGLWNARSLPALERDVAAERSHAVVHNGDFAYDMYRLNATWGDLWFDLVTPVAATQYYMTAIGNHEPLYDALNYRSRFSMPGHDDPARLANGTDNLWYSFDVGNTHWVAYDTEVYFTYEAMEGHGGVHRNFGPYPDQARAQMEFLRADLAEAAARVPRPWIITFGHRPMYCSDSDDDDCTSSNNHWKDGPYDDGRGGLEKLFFDTGVDFVFEAHQHTYERLWPTFNGTVLNGTAVPGQPYFEPRAPVHIVTGAAGCAEDLQAFADGPLGDWSAVRAAAYGYGYLDVANHTHARWRQIDISGNDGEVIDEIWVVRK